MGDARGEDVIADFLAKADNCEQQARGQDPDAQRHFRNMAAQWRELARIRQRNQMRWRGKAPDSSKS